MGWPGPFRSSPAQRASPPPRRDEAGVVFPLAALVATATVGFAGIVGEEGWRHRVRSGNVADDLNAFQPDSDARDELTERLAHEAPSARQPALRTLVPLVYDELRAIAAKLVAHRSADACIQPTSIVHEAFLKLASAPEASWTDKSHFLALCARVMRQVLADHNRDGQRLKRGGAERHRLTLTTNVLSEKSSPVDAIALEDALARLEEIEPRAARVAEMRFLAGMTVEEVATVLDVSPRTVELDWRAARAWLRRELDGG